MRRLTTEEFIEKAESIHGIGVYDYSKVEYINGMSEICITCRDHGEFWQRAANHINKQYGCPTCGGKIPLNNQSFIKRAKVIHQDKYDYSDIEYINSTTKIKIICKDHGTFWQRPNDHLQGKGCTICGFGGKLRTIDDFVNLSTTIHGKLYDYQLVDYKNCKQPIQIICKTHGIFKQTPDNHLQGKGCPKCKSSKGEILVEQWLKTHNINFLVQYKFEECKNIKELPFDFFIPKKNILIEYDGKQHQTPIELFGGENGYKKRKINDGIKNEFAKKNGIKLIRIPYNKINYIDKILEDEFNDGK